MQISSQIQSFFGFTPNQNTAQAPTGAYPAASANPYGADVAFFSTTRAASGDSTLTKIGIGAFSGYKLNKEVLTGGQPLQQTAFSSIGIGAAVSGGISLVKNIAGVAHGKQSAGTSVANVLTDTIQGGVSALGGLAVGGGSVAALKALGVAGSTPLAIVGVVGGAVGAVFANRMLNTEGLRRTFNS